MKESVPDLLLEQLLLGELSPSEAVSVRSRLDAEPGGAARLEQLRTENEAVLEAHPPDVVARRIRARIDALEHEDEPGLRWPRWATAAVVAVAAAAVLAIALPYDDRTAPAGVDTGVARLPKGERIKGSAAVVVERLRGSAATPLQAGDNVSPGDMLQVSYRAGDWTHGVLVSLDGAGAVTLHFPDAAEGSTKLQREGTAVLHGFELDDAPDFERFLFFVADAPLEPAGVVRHVETLGRRPDAQTAPADPGTAKAVIDLTLDRRPLGPQDGFSPH